MIDNLMELIDKSYNMRFNAILFNRAGTVCIEEMKRESDHSPYKIYKELRILKEQIREINPVERIDQSIAPI
jgi:hypothetical protein